MAIDRKIDKQNYEIIAQQSLETLKQLYALQSDSPTSHLIEHHIAKILFWIGRTIEAKQIFKKLIASDPSADHSRLQLARILLKEENKTAAIEHLDIALSNLSNSSSLAVTLALYETLGNQLLIDLRRKYIDNQILQFMSLFDQTLNSSFDYPIKVLSKLANHLSFNYPEQFSYLCMNLPTPDNVSRNPSLMEAFANIQFAYYKCLKYSNFDDKDEKMSSARNLGERYYLEMGLDTDYKRNLILKFYIETEEFLKAKEIVHHLEDKNNQFNLQLVSKVAREIGHFSEAIVTINKAIEIETQGSNRPHYIAAFKKDKAETQFKMKDPTCLHTLQQAIGLQTSSKTVDSWTSLYREWQSSLLESAK